VKTNALDYIIVALLFIMIEEKEVHLVTFYFCTFKATELNYDTHNKKLLVVFEALLKLSIDVITDHKNLEYFLTTKILLYHKAR